MNKQKIDAIVVTYNRLEKLKHALECYDGQKVPFRNVIIVNNCSTDGTREFLETWVTTPSAYGKKVLSLHHNTGGSGGFFAGEKFALSLNPDWVFIADDDAYPEKEMLEQFVSIVNDKDCSGLSAICAEVLYTDGAINTHHRLRWDVTDSIFAAHEVPVEEYEKEYFQINGLSYVGSFISAKAMNSVGLVNQDFFIYQDDIEHSIRLTRYGDMICYPKLRIIHDEPQMPRPEFVNKALWKEYYAVRNYLYMQLQHFPKTGKYSIYNMLANIKAHKDGSLSPVNKMTIEGCKDAIRGRLGIHHFYRPGVNVCEGKIPYPKLGWKLAYAFFRMKRFFKH